MSTILSCVFNALIQFTAKISFKAFICLRVFPGLTSTKQRIECLAQGHNTVTPVRLEPTIPRSRVEHSTTEPPRFSSLYCLSGLEFIISSMNSGQHALIQKVLSEFFLVVFFS